MAAKDHESEVVSWALGPLSVDYAADNFHQRQVALFDSLELLDASDVRKGATFLGDFLTKSLLGFPALYMQSKKESGVSRLYGVEHANEYFRAVKRAEVGDEVLGTFKTLFEKTIWHLQKLKARTKDTFALAGIQHAVGFLRRWIATIEQLSPTGATGDGSPPLKKQRTDETAAAFLRLFEGDVELAAEAMLRD